MSTVFAVVVLSCHRLIGSVDVFWNQKKNGQSALTKTVYDDYTRNGKNASENIFFFFKKNRFLKGRNIICC